MSDNIEALIKAELTPDRHTPRDVFISVMALLSIPTSDTNQIYKLCQFASNLILGKKDEIGLSVLKSAASSLLGFFLDTLELKAINKDMIAIRSTKLERALGVLFALSAPSHFFLFLEKYKESTFIIPITSSYLASMKEGPCKDKFLSVALSKCSSSVTLIRLFVSHVKSLSIVPLHIQQVYPAVISECHFTDKQSTLYFLDFISSHADTKTIQHLSLLGTLGYGTPKLIQWIIDQLEHYPMESTHFQTIIRSISIHLGDPECDFSPLLEILTQLLYQCTSSFSSELLRPIAHLVEKFLSQSQKQEICRRLMAENQQKENPFFQDFLFLLAPSDPSLFEVIINCPPSKGSLKALEALLVTATIKPESFPSIVDFLLLFPFSKLTFRIIKTMALSPLLFFSKPQLLDALVFGLKERTSAIREMSSQEIKRISRVILANPEQLKRLFELLSAGFTSEKPLVRAATLRALSLAISSLPPEASDEKERFYLSIIDSVLETITLLNFSSGRAESHDASLLLVSIFEKRSHFLKKVIDLFFSIAPLPLSRSFTGLLIDQGLQDAIPSQHQRLVAAVRRSKLRTEKKKLLFGGRKRITSERGKREVKNDGDNDGNDGVLSSNRMMMPNDDEDEFEMSFDQNGRLLITEKADLVPTNVTANLKETPEERQGPVVTHDKGKIWSANTNDRVRSGGGSICQLRRETNRNMQPYSYIPLSRKLLLTNRSKKKRSALLCIK